MVEALLELQAAAGNRSVAAGLGTAPVQRQPAQSGKNDGGSLTLDSGEAIQLQSATWSLKLGTKAMQTGHTRTPEIAQTGREAGNLVLTRSRDAQSARVRDLMGTMHERGSLRLDRPSPDGALPATSLALQEVTFSSYSVTRGDVPTETLTMEVSDLRVAGMGKEASDANAVAYLKVGTGTDAWPRLPVIALERERRHDFVSPGPGEQGPRTEGLQRFKVKIGAGMGMTRLAEALDHATRLEMTISPKRRGAEMILSDTLVVTVATSADGPNVVEVELLARQMQYRRP